MICDNCRGVIPDDSPDVRWYEDAVMAVPVRDGLPDMSLAGGDSVTVRTYGVRTFCSQGCEDAWWEGRAGRILRAREARLHG